MSEIKKAIEDYLEKQVNVYKSDEERIIRDTLGAKRAVNDHAGRWLWELLQNSDDAHAKDVVIQISDNAIYIADKGDGLKPEAVKSISGIDLSDKTKGTIGRKGIGFKSVYNITSNPQFFSGDDGLEFSEERAREWLSRNGFLSIQLIPYIWLPFFVLRKQAEEYDRTLNQLIDYKTVVKLPLAQEPKELNELQAYSLLPFRCLRRLEIRRDAQEPHILEIKENNGGIWTVSDNKENCVKWRVQKNSVIPPEKVLTALDRIDRKWIASGISFLIAAPLDTHGVIHPLDDYLPLHVFNPAENDLAPVRILLHAEFLVKSDRSAVIPISVNIFNDWVAYELVDRLIVFLHDNYNVSNPAAYLRLVVPLSGMETHHTAKNLWDKFISTAQSSLRLPNINGELILDVSNAGFINVSVGTEKARRLLEGTSYKDKLVHASISNDNDIKKVLRNLKCQGYDDNSIIEVIGNEIAAKVDDHEWIWNCWEWLAGWIAKEPYGIAHTKRMDCFNELPLLPIENIPHSIASLRDKIISWRSEDITMVIPEWLPLNFIDSWFKDKVLSLPDEDPIKKLSKELGLEAASNDTILKALSKAFMSYWKEPNGNPGRFIEFLLYGNWCEEHGPIEGEGLRRCPIPANIKSGGADQWVEAGQTYFGEEWGEKHSARLYEGFQEIAWACVQEDNKEKYRAVLEWLGVVAYPRIVEGDKSSEERNRIKKYIEGDSSPGEWPSPSPLLMDRLSLSSLSPLKAQSLICLLARNWKIYYQSKTEMNVKCEGPRGGWRCPERVPALWWDKIKEQLQPPILKNYANSTFLSKCWLPHKETEKAIGDLLPVIDLEIFGADKRIIEPWLKDTVHLRSHLSEITIGEWRDILSKQIPSIINMETDERYKDKVKTWYKACLDSLSEQYGISNGVLSKVPLLCSKGNTWGLINKDEQRWVNNDNQAAEAFKDDIWLITLPVSVHSSAKKYFDIKLLSEHVEYKLKPYEQDVDDNSSLQEILSNALPFVYTWECYKGGKENGELKRDLKRLEVIIVRKLKAEITLTGVGKVIERFWDVDGEKLLITEEKGIPESFLSQALSKFLHQPKTDAFPEFYENLLRCKNDDERKAKLISKNVPCEEIERHLREFNSTATVSPSGKPTEAGKGLTQGQSGTQDDIESSTDATPPAADEKETVATSGGLSTTPPSGTDSKSTGVDIISTPQIPKNIRIKDPDTATVVMADTGINKGDSGGISIS